MRARGLLVATVCKIVFSFGDVVTRVLVCYLFRLATAPFIVAI